MALSPSQRLRFLLAVCVFACLAVSPSQHAWAQADEPGESQTDPDAGEVVSSEGTVEIGSAPMDDQIARRIAEILDATERYESLGVSVRDGVVVLSGMTGTDETRQLATTLANRVEGVVAVLNEITIDQSDAWSLEPAKREISTLLSDTINALPLLAIGIVLFVIFFFAARIIGRFAGKLLSSTTDSELLQNVLSKAITLIVIVFGVYLALRVTGLTRVAITVVSGTGLLGLILGFAFRDIAENFLASLLLSIQRPFRLGDVIEVDGHTGVVRKVTSRGTLLIDFDGNHIQIANATVYKNTIKNFTANPKMRIDFMVGVGYEDSIAHAQEVAMGVLTGHPAVLDDPEPLVLVEELGASTVNLRVYFWIDSETHSSLKLKSSVIRLVMRGLSGAGISMPDEAREVIFPNGVPVQMSQPPSDMHTAPTGDASMHSQPEPPVEQSADVMLEAEGDFSNETHDLKKQAEESRDPESGSNVLKD